MSSVLIKYAFLHGYASSPSTRKGIHLKKFFEQQHNTELVVPDLNVPSFEELTISKVLNYLESEILLDKCKEDGKKIKWRLIASSLGGMIGTRFTELYPERVDSLILLAPAFNTEERWRAMLNVEEWKRIGTREIYNYKLGSIKHVKFDIFEDLKNHPSFPIPNCLLTNNNLLSNGGGGGNEHCKLFIIHGKQDDVVTIDTTDQFLEKLEQLNIDLGNVKVFRVEDGHELVSDSTLQLIEKLVMENWLRVQ